MPVAASEVTRLLRSCCWQPDVLRGSEATERRFAHALAKQLLIFETWNMFNLQDPALLALLRVLFGGMGGDLLCASKFFSNEGAPLSLGAHFVSPALFFTARSFCTGTRACVGSRRG